MTARHCSAAEELWNVQSLDGAMARELVMCCSENQPNAASHLTGGAEANGDC